MENSDPNPSVWYDKNTPTTTKLQGKQKVREKVEERAKKEFKKSLYGSHLKAMENFFFYLHAERAFCRNSKQHM